MNDFYPEFTKGYRKQVGTWRAFKNYVSYMIFNLAGWFNVR